LNVLERTESLRSRRESRQKQCGKKSNRTHENAGVVSWRLEDIQHTYLAVQSSGDDSLKGLLVFGFLYHIIAPRPRWSFSSN
jgi:hypothetical protein